MRVVAVEQLAGTVQPLSGLAAGGQQVASPLAQQLQHVSTQQQAVQPAPWPPA